MIKKQPKIIIKRNLVDYAIEFIGFIAIILLIVLPWYYYNQLPDTIPTHFGLHGQADGFGEKHNIWTLPIVGIIMYSGLFILSKYPHLFNYPIEINEQNAKRVYLISTRIIRFLNTVIVWVFLYILYASVKTAQHEQNGLGVYFMFIFIFVILFVIIYYLIEISKKE